MPPRPRPQFPAPTGINIPANPYAKQQVPFVGPMAQEWTQAPPDFSGGLQAPGPMPFQYSLPAATRLGMPDTSRDNALMRLIELANQRQQAAALMDQKYGTGDKWQRLFHEASGVGTWGVAPPSVQPIGPSPDTARARQRYSVEELGGSGV